MEIPLSDFKARCDNRTKVRLAGRTSDIFRLNSKTRIDC
jgi:hypothetical protein